MESQSRYGIMEELNSKKIKTREEIVKLEKEVDGGKMQHEESTNNSNKEIESAKTNYKSDFENWKRKKIMEKSIFEKAAQRDIEKMQEEIEHKEATYEQEHKDWLVEKETELKTSTKNFGLWLKDRQHSIASKKEVLTEIEAGIDNLKEMSKETATK